MRYGFIIDNRKCIGCHACTTACKSEHDVPVGVFRTYVKQVEKGKFPDTRRVFSVLRCNHCTNAPCVEICPVEALYTRPDGIVDFDKNRCIGCKSCMQACPYDALYIDPDTHTAAKCNYCAHRVDIGLEPSCVNVCPEHAIISGDMDNPGTEIAALLSREAVTVRKAAKGTNPNLFYIDGDEASLDPSVTEKKDYTLWSAQTRGVGHFSGKTEKLACTSENIVPDDGNAQQGNAGPYTSGMKSVDVLTGDKRRVYDAPDKGILWGWEVSTYVWTKAISTGVFLVPFLAWVMGKSGSISPETWWWSLGLSIVFLSLTTVFLVKDLDKPTRFLYVIFRPQWHSWLVRGGYALAIFGGMLALWALSLWFEWDGFNAPVLWLTAGFAVLTAVYTAFLFAQAKGRDFWQSPALTLHMLLHSIMAGAASLLLLGIVTGLTENWAVFLTTVLATATAFNLLTIVIELVTSHPTQDSKEVANMIIKGQYAHLFWWGVIISGNLLPLCILWFGPGAALPFAGALVLAGIFITEKIWVEAPQRISLT